MHEKTKLNIYTVAFILAHKTYLTRFIKNTSNAIKLATKKEDVCIVPYNSESANSLQYSIMHWQEPCIQCVPGRHAAGGESASIVHFPPLAEIKFFAIIHYE